MSTTEVKVMDNKQIIQRWKWVSELDQMTTEPDGDWVEYKDVSSLESEIARLTALVDTLKVENNGYSLAIDVLKSEIQRYKEQTKATSAGFRL